MARAPLKRMLRRGLKHAYFEATFQARDHPEGHVLLLDVRTPEGWLQHIWVPRDGTGALPDDLKRGQRIRFFGTIEDARWAGRVNLVDMREVKVVA